MGKTMLIKKNIFLLLLCVLTFTGCNEKKVQHSQSYIDSYGRKINIPKTAEALRIISVAPSMTELFFELDAKDFLIARSDYCDYPPQAKDLPSVGSLIEPNLECIIALKPSLVVASDHFTKDSVNKLEQLNIPVYIGKQGNELKDFYRIIEDMGQITKKEENAQKLIEDMQNQVEQITLRVQQQKNHPKVYYMISFGESGDYAPGKNTFIANLIRIAGAINISDDANGWNYSREKIFAKDPDIILVSRSEIADQLKNDVIYSKLRAVQNNNVHVLKSGTAERPSLRNLEALLEMENIFFGSNE
jgi:iron complex transport system substrate-binding protein